MRAALEEDSTFAMAAYYEAMVGAAIGIDTLPDGRRVTDAQRTALRCASRTRGTAADDLGEPVIYQQEPGALAVAESLGADTRMILAPWQRSATRVGRLATGLDRCRRSSARSRWTRRAIRKPVRSATCATIMKRLPRRTPGGTRSRPRHAPSGVISRHGLMAGRNGSAWHSSRRESVTPTRRTARCGAASRWRWRSRALQAANRPHAGRLRGGRARRAPFARVFSTEGMGGWPELAVARPPQRGTPARRNRAP